MQYMVLVFLCVSYQKLFCRNKSEDHSNDKFDDGVDERESQMKANDILTMKNFKWENKKSPKNKPQNQMKPNQIKQPKSPKTQNNFTQ